VAVGKKLTGIPAGRTCPAQPDMSGLGRTGLAGQVRRACAQTWAGRTDPRRCVRAWPDVSNEPQRENQVEYREQPTLAGQRPDTGRTRPGLAGRVRQRHTNPAKDSSATPTHAQRPGIEVHVAKVVYRI